MVEDSMPVGNFRWRRPATPYEAYMEEQEIPVIREIGIPDLREITLAPWKQMGGQGAFLELRGVGGVSGLYVVEIPAFGALNPEKHMYEEVFYVIEGRGQAEIWFDGSDRKQSFEWQRGSLFTAPLNTMHRLINAASTPALLLAVTNAPPVFHIFRSREGIFNNSHRFTDRYSESEDFFKPIGELEKDPVTGRARTPSNILPDIVNCEIPLDQQRGVGHRTFFWNMAGNTSRGFIAQYQSGRYSKAHAHLGGAVLFCLQGSGYTITWPKSAGVRPWEAGNGHLVERVDYSYGGVVSAAPGTDAWFHAHFGVSKEPFRVVAFLATAFPPRVYGAPGDEVIGQNEDINKGGNTIEYFDEDPYIRQAFREAVEKNGAQVTMPEEVYRRPESPVAR